MIICLFLKINLDTCIPRLIEKLHLLYNLYYFFVLHLAKWINPIKFLLHLQIITRQILLIFKTRSNWDTLLFRAKISSTLGGLLIDLTSLLNKVFVVFLNGKNWSWYNKINLFYEYVPKFAILFIYCFFKNLWHWLLQ